MAGNKGAGEEKVEVRDGEGGVRKASRIFGIYGKLLLFYGCYRSLIKSSHQINEALLL